MELKRAQPGDFKIIREFYNSVIDRTPDMEHHAKWRKDSHPTDDTIRQYIDDGNMYMCIDGEELISVLALPFRQTEDYHPVKWGIAAADDAVATLHIFGVAPEYQGKGYGRKVLEMVVAFVRDNGLKACRIDTFLSNKPAQKMYESFGFEYRGEQNLYTPNAGFTDFVYYEMIL